MSADSSSERGERAQSPATAPDVARGEIGRLLERVAAIDPATLATPSFTTMLMERARSRSAGDLMAYRRLLERDPEEVERLVAAIAVPETWLFRYPRSFELLVAHLRSLSERSGTSTRTGPVRLLSVGCATGAEPFAIAMSALHAGLIAERSQRPGDAAPSLAVEPSPASTFVVEAVDRSPEALAIAVTGRLGRSALRGERPSWTEPYLRVNEHGATVTEAVLAAVRFRRADALAEPWDAGRYEAIFCRNVCVYLSLDARTRLLSALADALVDGGLLFLGHADSVGPPQGAVTTLEPVRSPHVFAWRRGAAQPRPALGVPPTADRARPSRSGAPSAHEATSARRPQPSSRTTSSELASPSRSPGASPSRPSTPGRPAEASPSSIGSAPPPPSLADARRLADAGDHVAADAALRAIAARGEVSAEACELAGVVALARGDAEAAQRALERAVYLEPRRASALLHLAMIADRRGNQEVARRWRERARSADRGL